MTNLVLVHAEENANKSNKTAYEYITSSTSKIFFENYKNRLHNLVYKDIFFKDKQKNKYIKQKIDNLLNSTDFNNTENRIDFINKNLNDTRYATSEIKTYLENYKTTSEKEFKASVSSGKITKFLRDKIFNLPLKNRDFYEHHAIDAIMIAYSKQILNELSHMKIFNEKNNVQSLSDKYSINRDAIIDFEYSFSTMNSTNQNTKFVDDTLYSFIRESNNYIQLGKIDIYTQKDSNLKKLDDIFINLKIKTLM